MYKQLNDIKVVLSTNVSDPEFGKIMSPTELELSDCVKGITENHHRRLEIRLSCQVWHCCKYCDGEISSLPECCPFKGYYYYHAKWLNHWKNFQLELNKGIAQSTSCNSCFCMIREYFVDVYPFDWNINESVTKITLQKRKIDVVLEEVKQSTLLNFRE